MADQNDNAVTRAHREAAARLIPMVASAWIEDPTHTYGLATPELDLLRRASQVIADACARDRAEAAERAVDADGYRVVWDWAPWARFIGARAQLIHEAVKEGRSFAEIRDWLSMDETQVRLIAMTDRSTIPGIPGDVWQPKEFQKPQPPESEAK